MGETQTARAYSQLRTEILSGALQPGYPLLEAEIAERLGMSRTPVRAAIARLQNEGLVEVVRRKGMYVKPLTPSDVEQIYEMMEGLEGTVVKLAVVRGTTEEMDDLQSLVERMALALARHELEDWSKADVALHTTLREMARNPYIEQELNRLDVLVERVRWMMLRLQGTPDRSTAEHRLTVEAICSGEGDQARAIHQAHWQRVRNQVVELLRNTSGLILRMESPAGRP